MIIDVDQAITELGHGSSAVLMGISLGGRAVMWEALHNPDSVSSLIVIDVTPGSAINGPYDVDEYLLEMARINRNWPRKDDLPLHKARKWLDQHFRELIPDDNLRAYVLTNLERRGESYSWKCNVEALSKNARSLRSLPKSPDMFVKATQFIGGNDSIYITKERHKDIYANFPNADIEMIDNCGHWVHFDQPQRFLQICTDFLLDKS